MDVAADSAEPGHPLHLVDEVPVGRIPEHEQHVQVGDRHTRTGSRQRCDAVLECLLDAGPRICRDKGLQAFADLLDRGVRTEAEVLLVHGRHVHAAGDEVVHPRHRSPHVTDEVVAILRIRCQDSAHARGAVNH